jgi:hypothetical protein
MNHTIFQLNNIVNIKINIFDKDNINYDLKVTINLIHSILYTILVIFEIKNGLYFNNTTKIKTFKYLRAFFLNIIFLFFKNMEYSYV